MGSPAALSPQVVSYNGFVFPFLTIGWSGHTEYDGTGRIVQGYAVVFRGTSVLTANTPTDLATLIASCLSALATPRALFLWKSGSQTMFSISAPGGAGDVPDRRWGPKPSVVGTPQHIGGLAARVNFEIAVFVAACSGTPGDVEEFWRTESYNLNASFSVVRTTAGQYRVRSGLSAGSTFLTSGAFWPTLPVGFKRTSIQHTLSNDGTIITFSIVDTQVHRTLPVPLSDGSATFTLHQRGAELTKTLSATFEAPLDVDKKVILQFIVALIKARFAGAFTTNITEFLTDFRITNHEFENKVDVSVMGRTCGGRNTSGTNAVNSFGVQALGWSDIQLVTKATYGQSGDAWSASSGTAVLYGMTGTGGMLPGPQPVFTICGQTYTPYEDQYSAGSRYLSPGTNSSATPSATGEQGVYDTSNYSNGATSNTYTHWAEAWTYILDRRIVRLPVTSAGTNTSAVDLIQRSAYPALKILQTGHASRLGAIPIYPSPVPVGGGGNHYVSQDQRRTETPKIMADGSTVEYSISWSYVIEAPGVANYANATSAGHATLITPQSQMFSDNFNSATATNAGSVTLPSDDGSY